MVLVELLDLLWINVLFHGNILYVSTLDINTLAQTKDIHQNPGNESFPAFQMASRLFCDTNWTIKQP